MVTLAKMEAGNAWRFRKAARPRMWPRMGSRNTLVTCARVLARRVSKKLNRTPKRRRSRWNLTETKRTFAIKSAAMSVMSVELRCEAMANACEASYV